MQKQRIIVIGIVISLMLANSGKAEDKIQAYNNQLHSIDLFYKVLSKKEPKISDFYEIFGKDNEAEMELIIRQDFPQVDLNEWDLNEKAVKHVNRILSRPKVHISRFIMCLKLEEPRMFAKQINYHVDLPPAVVDDFIRFTVRRNGVDGIAVIFEFSQDEPYIESIILPGERSIYSVIDNCVTQGRGQFKKLLKK